MPTNISPFTLVGAADSTQLDAFGRLRVSEPLTLFDSKQIYDNQPLFWSELLESGGGIAAAHSANTASTVITSTLETAGKFTRQSRQWFNYQPGKASLVLMTGVLQRSGGGTGVKRRVGMFNDQNGLFFEDDEGTVKVVRRSYVTGSAVDTNVAQTAWNIDKMDGTGPSGFIVDWSKAQIFAIDYEWLGVGRVRFALVIDGIAHPVHEFLNANNLTTVYMSTPNLPVRFQMETTASSPASTMECICASVISEGGVDNTGVVHYVSTAGTHVDVADENTLYAILGLRLKSTRLGTQVTFERVSLAEHVGSKELEWVLLFNPTVAGSPSYGSVANSGLEYFAGATVNTVTGGTQVAGGHFASAQVNVSGALEAGLSNSLRLGSAVDGTPDTMVLAVRPIAGATGADVEGGITWREFP